MPAHSPTYTLENHELWKLHLEASSGRLAEGIFHDLMNPLQAVVLAVESLDHSGSTDTMKDTAIASALEHCAKARALLALATERFDITKTDDVFSANEEIRNAVILAQSTARRFCVEFVCTDSEDITLTGNPLLYRQIVIDCLLEAAATTKRSHAVHIALTRKDTGVVLTLTYNGKEPHMEGSVTADILTHAFGGFFTASSHRKKPCVFEITIPQESSLTISLL